MILKFVDFFWVLFGSIVEIFLFFLSVVMFLFMLWLFVEIINVVMLNSLIDFWRCEIKNLFLFEGGVIFWFDWWLLFV